MIGDRYLTDVVFGNRNGMLSVRVAPIQLDGETAAVKLVRGKGHASAAYMCGLRGEARHAQHMETVDVLPLPAEARLVHAGLGCHDGVLIR